MEGNAKTNIEVLDSVKERKEFYLITYGSKRSYWTVYDWMRKSGRERPRPCYKLYNSQIIKDAKVDSYIYI